MLHPSTRKLIDKLIEMTASSKINWQEGDQGSCFYDTEGYRVIVGQAPSRVVLQDAGGRILETVTDVFLAGTFADDGMTYSLKVEQMVSTVRRQLTGSEAIIESIVSALDLDGDGIPDIDEDDPVEDVVDETSRFDTAFPDQTEMASRVAMLAEKVNGTPPSVEEITEAVDEFADEPAVTVSDAPEIDPVETEVLLPKADEPVGVTVSDLVEDFSAPPSEEPKLDDAVAGLAGGFAVLGAAAVVNQTTSELAEKSGMTTPDASEDGLGWTVPPDAEKALAETVEDYTPPDADSMDSLTTQFSPTESGDEIQPVGEVSVDGETQLTETKVATFGMIGAFGTDAPVPKDETPTVDAGLPLVDDLPDPEPEPDLVEPVIHTAHAWGSAEKVIDAAVITPDELVTSVSMEDDSEDSPDTVPEDMPVSLAGTPYITGVGRVQPAPPPEAEAPVEAIDGDVSDTIGVADVPVDDKTLDPETQELSSELTETVELLDVVDKAEFEVIEDQILASERVETVLYDIDETVPGADDLFTEDTQDEPLLETVAEVTVSEVTDEVLGVSADPVMDEVTETPPVAFGDVPPMSDPVVETVSEDTLSLSEPEDIDGSAFVDAVEDVVEDVTLMPEADETEIVPELAAEMVPDIADEVADLPLVVPAPEDVLTQEPPADEPAKSEDDGSSRRTIYKYNPWM